eukprot:858438-Pyramimonas_sp.AAC.1
MEPPYPPATVPIVQATPTGTTGGYSASPSTVRRCVGDERARIGTLSKVGPKTKWERGGFTPRGQASTL